MKHATALLLASLLLAPAATALSEFSATSRQIVAQGEAQASGTLAAILIRADEIRESSFELKIHDGRLETDEAQVVVYAGGVQYSPDPQTTTRILQDARVQGTGIRTGYRLSVFPQIAADIQVRSDCLAMETPDVDAVSVVPFVGIRPPQEASLEEALQAITCEGLVRVTGKFVVGLWEWDAYLKDGEQPQDISTGRRTYSPAPTGSVTAGREAYLFVDNGTLEITSDQASVYLEAPAVSSAAGFVFMDVQTSSLPIHRGADANVTGSLRGNVQRSENLISATLGGKIKGVRAQGTTIYAPETPGRTMSLPWLAAGVVISLLAAWAIVPALHYRGIRHALGQAWPEVRTWRQRRAVAFFHWANSSEERDRRRLAYALVSHAHRLWGEPAPINALRGILLYAQGRLDLAITFLLEGNKKARTAELRAITALFLGSAYKRQGNAKEAARWMSQVDDIDPALLREFAAAHFSSLPPANGRIPDDPSIA